MFNHYKSEGDAMNAPKVKRAYSKSELADAAGVSYATFGRWLRKKRELLTELGVNLHTHILPPVAVEVLCEQYGISINELR